MYSSKLFGRKRSAKGRFGIGFRYFLIPSASNNRQQAQNLDVEPYKCYPLVLYTDGVTEATNTSFEEFGEQRLEDTLEDVALHNCQEIIDAIKSDVATFVGEAEQSDDITILAIRRL